jgi:hypothetical protein
VAGGAAGGVEDTEQWIEGGAACSVLLRSRAPERLPAIDVDSTLDNPIVSRSLRNLLLADGATHRRSRTGPRTALDLTVPLNFRHRLRLQHLGLVLELLAHLGRLACAFSCGLGARPRFAPLDANPGAHGQMLSESGGQITVAPWTEVPITREWIDTKFCECEDLKALRSHRDGMVTAIDDEGDPFSWGQHDSYLHPRAGFLRDHSVRPGSVRTSRGRVDGGPVVRVRARDEDADGGRPEVDPRPASCRSRCYNARSKPRIKRTASHNPAQPRCSRNGRCSSG